MKKLLPPKKCFINYQLPIKRHVRSHCADITCKAFRKQTCMCGPCCKVLCCNKESHTRRPTPKHPDQINVLHLCSCTLLPLSAAGEVSSSILTLSFSYSCWVPIHVFICQTFSHPASCFKTFLEHLIFQLRHRWVYIEFVYDPAIL